MENKGNNSANNSNTDPADLGLWGSMWSGYAEANATPKDDASTDADSKAIDDDAAKKHQAEKAKYTGKGFNGGWAKMTHWYKEHPDELSDIMFDGAEHDLEWYQQNPDQIGNLVRDWLARDESTTTINTDTTDTVDTADIVDTNDAIVDAPDDTTDQAPADPDSVIEAPGPVLGQTPLLTGPVKAEIGEINIKGIEQEFSDYKQEKLDAAKETLDGLRSRIAELYARNRRLIVGTKNRANFFKVKGEYGQILDEYLKLKSEGVYEKGKHEIAEKLEARVEELRTEVEQKLTEFAGGDLEYSEKSQQEIDAEKARLIEEAEQTLRTEYSSMTESLKGKVNEGFLHDLIEQETALEKTTTDKLDNGTLCRKVVSKVLHNKVLKGALTAAAAAGLVFTGASVIAGVAAGTMAVGLGGYTAGGVALGAARGFLSGAIMSRQDSKNSAVRGFVDKDEIKSQLESIDITDPKSDTSNVTSWLLEKYYDANNRDTKSNRARTIGAAALGAAIGGFMSGVHIDSVQHGKISQPELKGYTEPQIGGAANLENVDVPKGKGLLEVFRDLNNGSEEGSQQALEIAKSITAKYNESGASGLAEVYPGKISSWPDTAKSYITELADAWAKQGLVPATKVGGGEPIYSTIEKAVTNYIPHAFMNIMTQVTASLAIPGVIGSAIGDKGRSNYMEYDNINTSKVSSETPSATSPNIDQNPEIVKATSELADNFLDIFQSLTDEDQSRIIECMLEPEADASSPIVKGFLNNYNSAPQAVQKRVLKGMQNIINTQINQTRENLTSAPESGTIDVDQSAFETQSSNPEISPEAEFVENTRRLFQDKVSAEGLALLTDMSQLADTEPSKIKEAMDFWSTLPENIRKEIEDNEKNNSQIRRGTLFNQLILNPPTPPNAAMPPNPNAIGDRPYYNPETGEFVPFSSVQQPNNFLHQTT